jgi:methylated-DNA-[protein]-cysteine S-methyltransferase
LKQWLRTDAGRQARADYRATMKRLHDTLGDHALAQPAPPVYYAALDSPVGRIFVAASPAGLARVGFGRSDSAFVRTLRAELETEIQHSSKRLAAILGQIAAYFAGQRRAFALPIDTRLMTPFQRRVLDAASHIPAGSVASYGDIARAIGKPGASRAVGQALGRNPIPIVIPCHRVVAANGRLGGYIGGAAIKQKLLSLENAPIQQ